MAADVLAMQGAKAWAAMVLFPIAGIFQFQ